MDIVAVLSSLNKIGLVAFLITLGFLIYEIVLLTKTGKANDQPQVPQFQDKGIPLAPNPVIVESKWKNLTKNNKIILLALSTLLIVFGVLTLVGYMNSNLKSSKAAVNLPTTRPTLVPVKSITPSKVVPTYKSLDSLPSITETPSPTETTAEPTLTSGLVRNDATQSSTLSPTEIQQLPVTGYINNSLILFATAGLFIFLSFLF